MLDQPIALSSSTRSVARRPVDGVLGAIGDTPLVHLRRYPDRRDVAFFAKLEATNPGGSAKDRPAARMLDDAWARGLVGPGSTVVESSSGNMGVGLAQACRCRDLAFVCVVDSRANVANVRTMEALGADVRIVTRPDPETGDLLTARRALVAEIVAATPGAFRPDQYANPENAGAHEHGTMREIVEALDGRLDVLLVATSTTGTLRGCVDALRAHGLHDTTVVAVDAVGSALFGGERGRRMLPGFGAGMRTELSESADFDRLERVADLDCVVGCRRLALREGLLAGASGGAVAAAFDRIAPGLEPGSRCAAILHDGGTRYLETVYDDAWVARELDCPPARLAALVDGTPGSGR
ncbi:pyridoxal-phosphate dependent enzyme [Patulibacter minatonensis]|uniref:pyridoxal-phosphate dependent enzyme n=1 Tax=Patulibacter minatonensis TaxID=298163 RepID=UPI000687470A|nr:pyridoxal-phosphate dependent enzyme [Patulibacter minatonensis]